MIVLISDLYLLPYFLLHVWSSVSNDFCFSRSMQVVSTAMGKDAPVFITWFATWCGAYGIALWKGWKVALACMAFSPLIVLLGTILGKVSMHKESFRIYIKGDSNPNDKYLLSERAL